MFTLGDTLLLIKFKLFPGLTPDDNNYFQVIVQYRLINFCRQSIYKVEFIAKHEKKILSSSKAMTPSYRAVFLASLALAIRRCRRRREKKSRQKRRQRVKNTGVNGKVFFLSWVKMLESIIINVFPWVHASNIHLNLLLRP